MDTVGFDDDGMLICTVHHKRRYGWASLPQIPGVKLADWRFQRNTPLEIEAYEVFYEIAIERPIAYTDRHARLDTRDNRDPQSMVRDIGLVEVAGVMRPFYEAIREGFSRAGVRVDLTPTTDGSKKLPWPQHMKLAVVAG